MEKKEREQLKGRLLKMVVNEPRVEHMPPMTMAEVMVSSMSKPNLEPLLDFISQELDKAREEGRREVYKAIVFDENIPHDITTFVAANLWKNMRDKAKEELSKLKDNR